MTIFSGFSPRASRYILLGLSLTVNLAGCKHVDRAQPYEADGVSGPVDVGMVQLLADPKRYDGQFVRTHGFLSLDFEGVALYLHEDDYRYALTKNSFALQLAKTKQDEVKSLDRRYVIVEGRVRAGGLEQRDAWGGAISDITRLQLWPFDHGPLTK